MDMTLTDQIQEPEMDSFSKRFSRVAEKKEAPDESWLEWGSRNLGQQAARSTETVLGYPGNIKGAFLNARNDLTDMLGIKNISEQEKSAFGEQDSGSFADFFFNPPTSGEIREKGTKKVAKAITGKEDYLEPKNYGEKVAGDLNQKITSFFLPGTRGMNMMTRIGAPIASQASGEAARFLGADEKLANKVENGVSLAFSVANQSNPAQMARQRIQQGRQGVPQGATAGATALDNNLGRLETQLDRGLNVPSKSQTRAGINQLRNRIQNGRIDFEDLFNARDDINEWISEAGGWDVPVAVRDRTLANLGRLKDEIISTLDRNMNARFPQAANLYQTGYQAAAVTHRSNAISNFIERNFGRKAASVGAKLLFPSMAGGAAFLPKTVATGAALYPLYKTGQVLYRVSQSPTLAQYYQNVMLESMRGNVPGMVNNMVKLDKALEKEEKKDLKGKKQSLESFKSKFKKTG
jgi:hypothetical protein